jgi:hypothetical protein
LTQDIDIIGLEVLEERFVRVLRERPALRASMHQEVAGALKQGLDQRVGNRQRIRDWQGYGIGSGGGHAYVRAIAGKGPGVTAKQQYANSPGAITNYLESGHKVRPPSGKALRLRKSRAKRRTVEGLRFYHATRLQAQRIGVEAANRYADAVAERLGD